MSYRFGQIVLASVADGHGHFKPHPAVIVTRTEDIVPGERIQVVCISTQIADPCPAHHIPLPWQRPRHPRTGLNRANVAKCDWLVAIDEEAIIRPLGFVPAVQMRQIVDVLQMLSDKQAEANDDD